jgi:molybdopterin-guanine dinucleotide biosynthesis protein A
MRLANITRSCITGLILSGGRGTRMDGRDKGLELLNGKPLVAHAISRIDPQVGRLVLSVNRNRDRYAEFGLEMVSDQSGTFDGPLAGILSAMQNCTSPWLMSVPCDTPYLPENLVARLVAGLQMTEGSVIAYPRTGDQVHPACMLLHTGLRDSLANYLHSGGRKIDRWACAEGLVEVDFADHFESFNNINTAEELAAISLVRPVQDLR